VTPENTMRLQLSLRSRGVTDARVLTAMELVDRALFVTETFAARAYDDVPLPVAVGQTISQPSVVGLMTQALDVQPRDKVLEVGTGTGYQSAILSHLARRVYTVERHRALTRIAQGNHQAMGLSNITQITGNAPLPGLSNPPARAERAAPPPISIAPPSPEAVPARFGRTDSIPAVALGRTIPLPRPTKTMKPKKLQTEP